MKFPPPLLLFSLLLIWRLMDTNPLQAQQDKIVFEKYGVAEGLPEEVVSSILQDQQGFMWFTTQNGLVKYDGYDFKTYKGSSNPQDSTSLQLRNLNGKIIEARNGKLWIGGVLRREGIASFDPRTEQFENYLYDAENPQSSIPYRNCYPIQEDGYGNIWFSSYSPEKKIWALCRLNPVEKKIYQYPYSVQGKINAFLVSGSENFGISLEDGCPWLIDEEKHLRKWNLVSDSFEIKYGPLIHFPDSSTTDTLQRLYVGSVSKLILVGRKGVYLWNPVKQQIDPFYLHDPNDSQSLAAGSPSYAFEDHYGRFWVKHTDSLHFSVIDPTTQKCQRFMYGEGKLTLTNGPREINEARIQVSDTDGLLFTTNSWKSGKQGYLSYDFASESFHYYDKHFNEPKNNLRTVLSLCKDRSGLLWISIPGGFYRQAPKQQQMTLFRHKDSDPHSLPSDTIHDLLEDSQQRVWIATWQGLARFRDDQSDFQRFEMSKFDLRAIKRVIEDSHGQIWAGGISGLFLLQEGSKRVQKFALPGKTQNIQTLFEDHKHRLWVATYPGSVFVLDTKNQQILKQFFPIEGDSTALQSNSILTIYQDAAHRIWLCDPGENDRGLFRLNETEDGFIHYHNNPQSQYRILTNEPLFLMEDAQDRLWVGADGGLFWYDAAKDQFELLEDPINMPLIAAYGKSKTGSFWLATYAGGGLVHFDPNTRDYEVFGESKGLLHNDLYSLIFLNTNSFRLAIDHFGKVWYPTVRGLSVFDPSTESFQSYFEKDGYHPNSKANISLVRQNGEVWLGSRFGLNRIDPAKLMQKDSTLPSVHITSVGILDSTYTIPDGEIFHQVPSFTKEIKLKHWQNDLSFEFVALHYLRSEANQYAWKLENYDEKWTKPSLERKANYTNLDPGTYTFRVKASNADGIWNEAGTSMTILISPPWWATWWAQILFAALILGIGMVIYRYQLRRQLEQAENLRLKELDSVKTRLYTNITHEFRTPLTVINGMAEQIKQPKESRELIQRNSQHLLRLVNQMLDLSKLESGKLELQLIQGDVIAYLQYLTESFHSLAASKQMELVFYPEPSELFMDYDEEKLQLIVSNLLSNAIKFSPEGSKVILHVQEEKQEAQTFLQFKVRDKGIGIPASKLPHIFDRFYQVDDSTTRKGKVPALASP